MDGPFQVGYAANLNSGADSYVAITNDGANGASYYGPGLGETGNICVNVYAFDPAEELISCCSCTVTPDQTVSLSVQKDILPNTITQVMPKSMTIKLLATEPGSGYTSTNCTNTAASVGTATMAVGMAAWGTTTHPAAVAGSYATTETAFRPATLSAQELTSLGTRCSYIIDNASGFGVCASCRLFALGSVKM